jgi:3',5'-cyclic AMP phosphodiesterase CpdA
MWKSLPLLVLALSAFAADEHFFAKPYLQIGNRPVARGGALELMWLSHDSSTNWLAEYEVNGKWKTVKPGMLRRVDFAGTPPHRVYSASLTDLKAGAAFRYRLTVAGQVVFEGASRGRKAQNADTSFIVFGDAGANSPGQKELAVQVNKFDPDYIFIPGDIVYSRGRVSEYATNWWPIFNHDTPDPTAGAPLLRRIPFIATVGNHDSQIQIPADNPDPLAFHLYWNQPLNGPTLLLDSPYVPKLGAFAAKFYEAARPNFPNAVNYSFDYGNVHWTVLDSNSYVDWTDPSLQAWLQQDLAAAAKARWRIVAFHHPPYHSSKVSHFREQRLRVISPLLEQHKVDLVLSGHVHNYQRTFPLRFAPEPGFVLGKNQEVPGQFTLDKDYDGVTKTKPNGVIYITTGAGGAGQYPKEYEVGPDYYQPFTTKFVGFPHSFSVIDATAKQLTFRQIDSTGKERDRFIITR